MGEVKNKIPLLKAVNVQNKTKYDFLNLIFSF